MHGTIHWSKIVRGPIVPTNTFDVIYLEVPYTLNKNVKVYNLFTSIYEKIIEVLIQKHGREKESEKVSCNLHRYWEDENKIVLSLTFIRDDKMLGKFFQEVFPYDVGLMVRLEKK